MDNGVSTEPVASSGSEVAQAIRRARDAVAAQQAAQADQPIEDQLDVVFGALPEQLRKTRGALLDDLRTRIAATGETLSLVAGADSKTPGLLALTDERLMFLYTEGWRKRVTCTDVAIKYLRGARVDGAGLIVQRYSQQPERFTGFIPEGARQTFADYLGRPPIDWWTDSLSGVNPWLLDELNTRIPVGDSLLGVASTYDNSGFVALTEGSLMWIYSPPATSDDLRAGRPTLVYESWDRRGPPAEMLRNEALQIALCRLYSNMGDWEKLAVVSSRSTFLGADLYKADALVHTGMTDAALVAYTDAIHRGNEADANLEHVARYRKAGLLIKIGELGQARQELARLYANDPTFADEEGLLGRVNPAPRLGQTSIPEEVRHAVWRRDRGCCVECRSSEELELDHIVPLSLGGSNTERNVQILCATCSRRKRATI